MGPGRVVEGPGQAGHDIAPGYAGGGEGLPGFGAFVLREAGRGGGKGAVEVLQGPAHGHGCREGGRGRQGGEFFGRHKCPRVAGQPPLQEGQRLHPVIHRNAAKQLLHVHMRKAVGIGIGAAQAQVGRGVAGASPLAAHFQGLAKGLLGVE